MRKIVLLFLAYLARWHKQPETTFLHNDLYFIRNDIFRLVGAHLCLYVVLEHPNIRNIYHVLERFIAKQNQSLL